MQEYSFSDITPRMQMAAQADRCVAWQCYCLPSGIRNRQRNIHSPPSILAWECHLPSVQPWLRLGAFIFHGAQRVPGSYLFCSALLHLKPLQTEKGSVSFPLSSSFRTKHISPGDNYLLCQNLDICIANSGPWNLMTSHYFEQNLRHPSWWEQEGKTSTF